jgi:hypothetical protein
MTLDLLEVCLVLGLVSLEQPSIRFEITRHSSEYEFKIKEDKRSRLGGGM